MLNFKQPIAKISNSISNLKLPNKDIVANCNNYQDVVDLLEDAGYEIEPVDRDEVTFNQGNITLYCQ